MNIRCRREFIDHTLLRDTDIKESAKLIHKSVSVPCLQFPSRIRCGLAFEVFPD